MMLRRVPILVALAAFSAGCSSDPFQTAPVTGRITVNGKPVAQVAVMFQPNAADGNNNPGPGSTGITDAEGNYSLKLIGKETKGAVIGKHQVRITNFREATDPADDNPKYKKPAVPIPPKYYLPKAALEFDVPAKGSDSANFDLTAP